MAYQEVLYKILRVQVLINQLKDVAPTIQNSISELTEEVNSISSNLPPAMNFRSNSPIQAQSSGRTLVTYVLIFFPFCFLKNFPEFMMSDCPR